MKPTKLNPKVSPILWVPAVLGGGAFVLSIYLNINILPPITIHPDATRLPWLALAFMLLYLWGVGLVLYLLLAWPLWLCALFIRDDFNAAHARSTRGNNREPNEP